MISKLLKYTAFLGYGIILIPTIFVIGSSITATNYIVFPPQGLSLKWYDAAITDRYLLAGLRLSLEVGLASVLISSILATMAALYLTRPAAVGRQLFSTYFLAPLNVPSVMTAFALLLVFTSWGLINTVGLIIAHVVLTFPYILRTVVTSLTGSDRSIGQAAAILGANPWRVFWRVTLPVIRPGIISGAMFAFLVSFNNVVISVFIASPGTSTLPVVLFNRMEWLAQPSVAAAASSIVILTIVIMLILDRKFGLFQSLFR